MKPVNIPRYTAWVIGGRPMKPTAGLWVGMRYDGTYKQVVSIDEAHVFKSKEQAEAALKSPDIVNVSEWWMVLKGKPEWQEDEDA